MVVATRNIVFPVKYPAHKISHGPRGHDHFSVALQGAVRGRIGFGNEESWHCRDDGHRERVPVNAGFWSPVRLNGDGKSRAFYLGRGLIREKRSERRSLECAEGFTLAAPLKLVSILVRQGGKLPWLVGVMENAQEIPLSRVCIQSSLMACGSSFNTAKSLVSMPVSEPRLLRRTYSCLAREYS